MKKLLVANALVCLAFIASEPLLTRCGDWADTYSLGAEMVLGMLIPVILFLFFLFAFFSALFSLYRAVAAKDIKEIIPIFVFVAFVAIYIVLSTQDSFWIRVIEYYKINSMP